MPDRPGPLERHHAVDVQEVTTGRRTVLHVAVCACGWRGNADSRRWKAQQSGELHQDTMLMDETE